MDDVLRRKVWRFLAGELSRAELTAWVASQLRHPAGEGRLPPLWTSVDHALCLPDLADAEMREELRSLVSLTVLPDPSGTSMEGNVVVSETTVVTIKEGSV